MRLEIVAEKLLQVIELRTSNRLRPKAVGGGVVVCLQILYVLSLSHRKRNRPSTIQYEGLDLADTQKLPPDTLSEEAK